MIQVGDRLKLPQETLAIPKSRMLILITPVELVYKGKMFCVWACFFSTLEYHQQVSASKIAT